MVIYNTCIVCVDIVELSTSSYRRLPRDPRQQTLRVLSDHQLAHLVQAVVVSQLSDALTQRVNTYTRRPSAKVSGMKKNSTGTGRVWNTPWLHQISQGYTVPMRGGS